MAVFKSISCEVTAYAGCVRFNVSPCSRFGSELAMDFPAPEGEPPSVWWDAECDRSLLVGVFKHGKRWELLFFFRWKSIEWC